MSTTALRTIRHRIGGHETAGGHWWDVAVPEVSERAEVRSARAAYESAVKGQRLGD